uniref:Metallophos domain-containing protein n=1 Tax=Panagrellus redivivus TaxID=6233 RepID=A0A7E4W4K2_PANRE
MWADSLFVISVLVIHLTSCAPVEPEQDAQRLLAVNHDELILIFTGDTQYYYPCTLSNRACRQKSVECRTNNGLDEFHRRVNKTSLRSKQIEELELECIKIESRISNTAQRRSIFDLNRRLINKPKALIMNGDLTNFGHARELIKFKEEWMTLPMYLLAGLGNHDYENNVDDCIANQCANNMLYWFVRKYAPSVGLALDYTSDERFFKTTYKGSFAYAKTLCTENQETCVRVIQLNNRPDYTTSIQSASQWEVQSSLQWLKQELEMTNTNRTWPVLINLHNLESKVEKRLKAILRLWLNSAENSSATRKVAVFHAHLHEKHEHRVVCVGGVTVPFIFVGSVPNNRYTTIKFTDAEAKMFFMRSNIDNATSTIVKTVDFRWRPC